MFKMIPADESILNKVSITFEGTDPISGWTVGKKVDLQFPPRIRGNSKKANWKTQDARTYEPIAIWMGSDATMLDLELQYVVTGGKWNIPKISSIVHNIMGYFYRSVRAQGPGIEPPVVKIQLYEVAPSAGGQISTWRIENCSLDQTDELILDNDKVYPQVTVIKLSLAMITKIGAKNSKGEVKPAQLQKSQVVPLQPAKEWY